MSQSPIMDVIHKYHSFLSKVIWLRVINGIITPHKWHSYKNVNSVLFVELIQLIVPRKTIDATKNGIKFHIDDNFAYICILFYIDLGTHRLEYEKRRRYKKRCGDNAQGRCDTISYGHGMGHRL